MTRLHDIIRQILETSPHLTQRGLAERMGLDPAAVNRMLYGRRGIMAEEIPVIEEYLGQRLALDVPAAAPVRLRGVSDVVQQGMSGVPVSTSVPVYPASGGTVAVDWVPRFPAQAGVAQAFALYMPDDTMRPRYYRGELVYVHPGRPAEAGRDAVIESKDGAYQVVRVLSVAADVWRVQKFFPDMREYDMRISDTAGIYAVVGRG